MNQYLIIGAVLAAVVALGGLLIWMAFRSARKRGAAEAQRDDAKRTAEQADEALEIDEAVADLSDDDLDDELWGR